MAIDPNLIRTELEQYGDVQDMNYNDLVFIVVMTNVLATDLSNILNILEAQVTQDYPVCDVFNYSDTFLKIQYISNVPQPPASNNVEQA